MAQESAWKQLWKPQFVEPDTEIPTLCGLPAKRGSPSEPRLAVSARLITTAEVSIHSLIVATPQLPSPFHGIVAKRGSHSQS